MKTLNLACIVYALFVATSIAKTPEDFLESYLESLKSKGYAESIDMFHPDAFTEFAAMIRGGLAARLKKDGPASRLDILADPKDPYKLDDMNDKEITRRFFKLIEDGNPGFREMNLNQKVKIIGAVSEQDTATSYVVVKTVLESANKKRREDVEVFTMRKKGSGDWGMLVSHDWLELGRAFGNQ